jgi:hypothetical protein
MSDKLKEALREVRKKRASSIGPWKQELLPESLIDKYDVKDKASWAMAGEQELPNYDPDTDIITTHPFEGPTVTAHELGHHTNTSLGAQLADQEDKPAVIKQEQEANKVARTILKDTGFPVDEDLLNTAIQSYMAKTYKKESPNGR